MLVMNPNTGSANTDSANLCQTAPKKQFNQGQHCSPFRQG